MRDFLLFFIKTHIVFIIILLWHQIQPTVTIITNRVKNTKSSMMRGTKVLKLILGGLNRKPLLFQK